MPTTTTTTKAASASNAATTIHTRTETMSNERFEAMETILKESGVITEEDWSLTGGVSFQTNKGLVHVNPVEFNGRAWKCEITTAPRSVIAFDVRDQFNASEIKAIDRACKRRKITRGELITDALRKGLNDFRASEESNLETELAAQSADIGIPLAELKRMCMRAGLDQLQRDGLKVRLPEGKLPLMLPSWIVQRLADAGRVADLENPDTAIAEAVLGDLAKSPVSVKETVTDAFVLKAPKATAKKLDKLIAGWSGQSGDEKGGAA